MSVLSPRSSGMFEDSAYVYLIEPMDLTHSAVSLFWSDFHLVWERERSGSSKWKLEDKSVNQWSVLCSYGKQKYFKTPDWT